MSLTRRARWVAEHGLSRVVLRRQVRRGELLARLIADPGMHENPFDGYDQLRERGPLPPWPFGRVSARHDVCTSMLRSTDFGHQPPVRPPPLRLVAAVARRGRPLSIVEAPSLLAVNPPDHTRYRKLVTRVFTVRAIEALRGSVHEVADELLEQLSDEPTVDLMTGYASLLPVTMIAEVLGVPTDMRETLLGWGRLASPSLDHGLPYRDFERAEIARAQLQDWMLDHFAQLRRDPGDDLLSRLIGVVDEGGEQLTEHELLVTAILLLIAGFETTVNLLGSGAALLLGHPDQRELLREDPARWSTAVDEILRLESPVQFTGRHALRDTEVHGVPVPQGTDVLVALGGANRDPEVFDDPHRFDVTRANAREHLAFSTGSHFCLGAALARLQGEIGLRKLFERFPDLTVAGEPQRRFTWVLRGYETLPLATQRGSNPARPEGIASRW